MASAGGPTWDEFVESGAGSVSFSVTAFSKRYSVCGAANESVVMALVEAKLAGGGYDTLTVNGVRLFINAYKIDHAQPTDGTQWVVTLEYRYKVAAFELSGDTTGGTRKMLQALDQGEYYRLQNATDPMPDFQRLVGVDGQKVNGVDVPDYKREFTVLVRDEWSLLPADYLQTIEELTGKCNDAFLTIEYKGQNFDYEAEELLFLGMIDKQTSNDGLELVLKFAVQRTQELPPIANSESINGGLITKPGWRYGWVYSTNGIVNGARVPKPQFLVINQVIETADLSRIGIFS